jgi:hypothetical protein
MPNAKKLSACNTGQAAYNTEQAAHKVAYDISRGCLGYSRLSRMQGTSHGSSVANGFALESSAVAGADRAMDYKVGLCTIRSGYAL